MSKVFNSIYSINLNINTKTVNFKHYSHFDEGLINKTFKQIENCQNLKEIFELIEKYFSYFKNHLMQFDETDLIFYHQNY